jgi:tetratricopeptide (TPR) repeat protein
VVTNKEDLQKALKWSDKAIALSEASYAQTLKKMKGAKNFPVLHISNYLDTNARLLYRLGEKQKAIEMQGRAITSHKLSGMPTASFENVRAQMINGTF